MKKKIFLIKTDSCQISRNDFLNFVKNEKEIHKEFEFIFSSESSIKKFNDGEISVNLNSNDENFEPKQIFSAIIFTSVCRFNSSSINDQIIEILILCDALKRAGIERIKLIPLYLGYLRQDRRLNQYIKIEEKYKKNLEPITSSLVLNLFEKSGVSDLILVDPHFSQVEALMNNASNMKIKILEGEFLLGFIFESILRIFFQNYLNIDSINQKNIINFFKKICHIQIKRKFFFNDEDLDLLNFLDYKDFFHEFCDFLFSQFQITAPDAGSLKKLRKYAELIEEIIEIFSLQIDSKFFIEKKINVCFIEKLRTAPGASKTMSITNNLENSHSLIIDDILDSGSTLVSAANFLKKSSGAKSISAFITHGVCSLNCEEKIQNSEIQNMFLTNSIFDSKHSKFNKKFYFFSLVELLKYFINF